MSVDSFESVVFKELDGLRDRLSSIIGQQSINVDNCSRLSQRLTSDNVRQSTPDAPIPIHDEPEPIALCGRILSRLRALATAINRLEEGQTELSEIQNRLECAMLSSHLIEHGMAEAKVTRVG